MSTAVMLEELDSIARAAGGSLPAYEACRQATDEPSKPDPDAIARQHGAHQCRRADASAVGTWRRGAESRRPHSANVSTAPVVARKPLPLPLPRPLPLPLPLCRRATPYTRAAASAIGCQLGIGCLRDSAAAESEELVSDTCLSNGCHSLSHRPFGARESFGTDMEPDRDERHAVDALQTPLGSNDGQQRPLSSRHSVVVISPSQFSQRAMSQGLHFMSHHERPISQGPHLSRQERQKAVRRPVSAMAASDSASAGRHEHAAWALEHAFRAKTHEGCSLTSFSDKMVRADKVFSELSVIEKRDKNATSDQDFLDWLHGYEIATLTELKPQRGLAQLDGRSVHEQLTRYGQYYSAMLEDLPDQGNYAVPVLDALLQVLDRRLSRLEGHQEPLPKSRVVFRRLMQKARQGLEKLLTKDRLKRKSADESLLEHHSLLTLGDQQLWHYPEPRCANSFWHGTARAT